MKVRIMGKQEPVLYRHLSVTDFFSIKSISITCIVASGLICTTISFSFMNIFESDVLLVL